VPVEDKGVVTVLDRFSVITAKTEEMEWDAKTDGSNVDVVLSLVFVAFNLEHTPRQRLQRQA
jgi:hypothetical protein